jgi:hypothetical protein
MAPADLHGRYPEVDDIAAMFAEAWMNTMPWDYWSDGDTPRPETVPVIAALEQILARNMEHPLALHLYIHAVEASSNPGRAETAADTLAGLVPGSGHLSAAGAGAVRSLGRNTRTACAARRPRILECDLALRAWHGIREDRQYRRCAAGADTAARLS